MKTIRENKASVRPDIAAQNARRANVREFLNQTSVVYADLHIEQDEQGWTSYGIQDATIFCKETQDVKVLHHDNSKFTVSCEDFETARSEFWQRWAIYCNKRFGRKVSIEIRNTFRS